MDPMGYRVCLKISCPTCTNQLAKATLFTPMATIGWWQKCHMPDLADGQRLFWTTSTTTPMDTKWYDPNGHEVICQGMSGDLHHRLCRYASATLMLLSQHHRTIVIRSSCGSPSARCNVSYWPATNGLRHIWIPPDTTSKMPPAVLSVGDRYLGFQATLVPKRSLASHWSKHVCV
jgi:hypothetical protein